MGQEVVERRKLRLSNLTQFKKDLKTLVKNYDDPKHKGKYISVPMVSNGEYLINIVIERKPKCATIEAKK